MKQFLRISLMAIFGVSALFLSKQSNAQSVSINSTGAAPHAQSILDITSTNKGVLLPRLTTAQRTGFTPTTTGMTVYDTTTESYWYWDDTANVWREIPNMTSIPSVSLDDAYNGGIFITADAGAVQITGTTGAISLDVDKGIRLAEDEWIGLGSSLERIEFDGSLNRLDIEGADLTMDDGKWIGVDGSSPRIEFEDASGRLNMQDADIEVDNGAWIGLNASNPRIEFDDTNNELNILDADLGVGTTAPDNQSLADFRSTSKGILFPRMTALERAAIGQGTNTDYGLWIYNEDTDHYNYWDGNSWEEVTITNDIDPDEDWFKTTTTANPTAITDWIYTNGNVGINVGSSLATNPLAALHAQSNAYIGDYNTAGFYNSNATIHLARTDNPHLLLEDIGHNTGGLSFDAGGLNVVTENGDIDFRTGVTYNGDFSATGNPRMIIKTGGNVGIGTTTPDANLNVGGTTGATIYLTREDATTTTGEVLGSLLFDSTDDTSPSTSDASAGIRAFASQDHGNSNKGGYLTFFTKNNVHNSTAATEHMRITAAGNVGIGVTNPTVKFQVSGDATISGKFNSNGIQESSDIRFKKNIAPLEDALTNLLKVEGVSYNWKQDEFPERNFGYETEIGVIAQELEKIYPELVSTDSDGYKSVQYSHLVPVLIEAIKEQQLHISSLNNDVAEITASLEAVKEWKVEQADIINHLSKQIELLNESISTSQK